MLEIVTFGESLPITPDGIMARSIFFTLLLATAIFAYVQALPVSDIANEEVYHRGDIPIEESYPELFPVQRGDIPIEESYPELFPVQDGDISEEDEETKAEIANFKDDLKNAWLKVKSAVKSKYEEVINDSKIRESLKETTDKLVDKTKDAVEKVLEGARNKIDKITIVKQNPSVAVSEVASFKDKVQEAWNDFKKLVSEKYDKIKDNPKVQKIIDEVEKAVNKAKDTANDIVNKARKEIEKIRD